MLFHFYIEINLSPDMPEEKANELRARETAQVQQYQREGKWPQMWRVAGRYANISIVDCADADELHRLVSALPLFPYITTTVTPLARHPARL